MDLIATRTNPLAPLALFIPQGADLRLHSFMRVTSFISRSERKVRVPTLDRMVTGRDSEQVVSKPATLEIGSSTLVSPVEATTESHRD